MHLIETLLERLTNHLPCRIIDGESGEPYLERYYLAGLGGWHAYLHRFVDSDPDRGLHDHPWDLALSLILTGGYDELRAAPGNDPPVQRRTRRPGGFNQLRGQDYHRILLRAGRPAWTLFVHGPRVKGWGFVREGIHQPMAASAADFRHRDWWRQAPKGHTVRTERAARPAA